MATEAPKTKRERAAWSPPSGQPLTELCILNSLTGKKEPFIAKNGKLVTAYICGPTVYDASHMGHARNYIVFDVIRRILIEYFGYEVNYVMNITDIDDKIIIRSNERKINFRELAHHWEKEFLIDMQALGVRPPHVLTRVSEYVPEIVSFVEGIIKNGFAYESNGSVYFDTTAFGSKHYYAKLCPNHVGDSALMAEGEGALAASALDKRAPTDFALWKKSKEGEPSWDSPWGPGRPGWHIECSAMAGDILGSNIDIHGGGEDLKFPHHDNELAQSEAYFNNQQWINYFLHSGHLHIEGRKMAKSLKNFITIRDALEVYTAKQLRLMFLLHRYETKMDYSEASAKNALGEEKRFSEFFHYLRSVVRKSQVVSSEGKAEADKTNEIPSEKWVQDDKNLNETLRLAQAAVHKFYCDSFDTPSVINELANVVKAANTYIDKKKAAIKPLLLRSVGDFVFKHFKIMGLMEGSDFTAEASSSDKTLHGVLDAFVAYRSDVRAGLKAKALDKVGEASDKVRDETLPLLGIRLADQSDGSAIWKLDDPAVLLKELQQKREIEQQKAAAKAEQLKKQQEKLEKMKIPAEKMFLNDPEYSKFDEKGIPTHDKEGKELSKKAQKFVQKEWEKQAKSHEEWKKSNNNN